MGYCLRNEENLDEFNVNFFAWRPLLLLAEAYGWEPKGTSLEGASGWQGSYLSNDGQTVSSEECEALIKAIEVALLDIPEEEITDFFKYFGIEDDEYEDYNDALRNKDHNTLMMHFSGDREFLFNFIEFLKMGEFSIY
tara:strand:+ start:2723 stop:3136 length:414 start_codon:yes stop_codon:yes gene_type:complete